MPPMLAFFGEIFISHNLAGSTNWQLSRFTQSTWTGVHKTEIYYLYQLFCAICRVNSWDMAEVIPST